MSTQTQTQSLVSNSWSDEKIRLLLKWRQYSRVYHWLHAKTSAHKHWWYSLLFYTATFLTAIGLGKNFSIFFTDETDVFIGIQISDTLLMTFIGVINIYIKTSKISELAEKHSNISKGFYILQSEIEEQLAQAPQDRDNGKTYIKKIRVKITSLTKDSPEISQSVWKKFSKAVENGEIFNESDPVTVYNKAESLVQSESKGGDVLSPKDNQIIIPIGKSPIPKSPVANSHQVIPVEPVYFKPPLAPTSSSPLPDNTTEENIDFTNKMVKSGKLKPNILRALDYQMARFN